MPGTIYWAEREAEFEYDETDDAGNVYQHLGATYRILAQSEAMQIPLVNQWLYETFSEDATIAATVGTRIYRRRIPQGAAFPALVYQHMGGVPVMPVIGSVILYSNLVYAIKVVGRGSSNVALQAAVNRIDELIHRTELVEVA